ncbi:MAG: tetratricopeptide repeat protein [Polyangiaceae bacterium]|nr:tetratricopeptide repeat protein [Polyangiaceae bacterium]
MRAALRSATSLLAGWCLAACATDRGPSTVAPPPLVAIAPPTLVAASVAEPEPAPPPEPPRAPPPGELTSAVLVAARHEVLGNQPPRARELTVTEAVLLGRLLDATPRTAADRPKLVRRLASTYLDLALRPLESADQAKTAQAALNKSVELLGVLVSTYPAEARTDESLFWLGRASELLGERARAREAYALLVRRVPDSSFAGRATERLR